MPRANFTATPCVETTVGELWRDPKPFVGRKVCLSGFLGRMVPYGEDSPKLYATPDEAEATKLERFATLGISLTIPVQERLSRYSAQPLRVEGVFVLEHPCLLDPQLSPSDSICSPPPSLRIAGARLIFADKTEFP
jgi:hypothetical protein